MKESKICSKCHVNKDIIEFHKCKTFKDGLSYYCKVCRKYYQLQNKIRISKYQKEWRKENKEKIRKYIKNYQINNKVKITKYKKYYQKKNKQKINRFLKDKRKSNTEFKILQNLRNRLRKVLKNNPKSKSTIKLIGCTISELKQHLEKQFKKGMTWDNYGLYGWHIDHIKQCCKFDLSKESEQHKCFNYKNLQPLWAKENLSRPKK